VGFGLLGSTGSKFGDKQAHGIEVSGFRRVIDRVLRRGVEVLKKLGLINYKYNRQVLY